MQRESKPVQITAAVLQPEEKIEDVSVFYTDMQWPFTNTLPTHGYVVLEQN